MSSEGDVQVISSFQFTFLKLRIPFTVKFHNHKPLNQIPKDFKTRRFLNSEFSVQHAHLCVSEISASDLHFPHIKKLKRQYQTIPDLAQKNSRNYKLFKRLNPFRISPKPCYRMKNSAAGFTEITAVTGDCRKVNEANEGGLCLLGVAAER